MLYTLGRLELHGSAYQHVKPLLFLAYLSLEGPQERRHVAEVFWSDSEHPLNALSALLFRLRRDLPGKVEADKTFIRSTVTSDASEFLNAVEQGRNQRALELYQGTFLKDIAVDTPPLETWLYTTREVLSQRAFAAAVELAETLGAQGELALATQQVEAALLLRETAVLEPDLLGCSYHLLHLGGSAKAEILRAEAQEFELELSDYETATTPRPTEKVQRTLPQDTGAFVGRRAELGRLAEQLAQPECRLITLLGPGGVGKSRSALELARRADQESFRDGVVWVALEALTSPELVPTRIADALGMTLQGKDEPLQQVIGFIGDKHLLLVLDNFEHLTAGATSAGKVLAQCPNAKVIATSRTRLNLKHEWTFALEGLPYRAQDGADNEKSSGVPDAQTLFYQRARRARLDFAVTEEDTPHLLELCQLVGGSPLALELAANWVRVMSVEELVQEIKANVTVLSSTHQDEPTRHQSMSAVLNQSWQRLTPEEQTALAKLSVFEGGFTRGAAAQVADVSLLMLTRLIDKSLLRREERGRYGFHPLMRQFAGQKLKDVGFEQARERHAEYFLEFAETAEAELTGSEQAVWLGRLEKDGGNFRVAVARAVDRGAAETALRLTGALGRFWDVRGYFSEGRAQLEKTLALADECHGEVPALAKAKALKWLGIILREHANYEAARKHLLQAAAICRAAGNALELANCLNILGLLAYWQANYEEAQRCYEESLRVARTVNDPRSTAAPLGNLGLICYQQSNFKAAQRYYEESLSVAKKLGDQRVVASLHNNLGNLARIQGEYKTADDHYRQSLSIREQLGHQEGLAASLTNLGKLARDKGDYPLARDYLERGLAIERELDDLLGISVALSSLGDVVSEQGDYKRAEHLYTESLNINRSNYPACAVQPLCGLGRLAAVRKNSADASEFLSEALELLNTPTSRLQAATPLEELGYLSYTLQKYKSAVKLWARASKLRTDTAQPLPLGERLRYGQNLAAAEGKLGTPAFQAAWKTGEAMTLQEVTDYALQISSRNETMNGSLEPPQHARDHQGA